jgi:hypothetical protein
MELTRQFVRDKAPGSLQSFFMNAWSSFTAPLYVYGSVVRGDYVPGRSDVDLCLFTDAEDLAVLEACHWFGIARDAFHDVVWKLNGVLIYGQKAKFVGEGDVRGEIAIYDSVFRGAVLQECRRGFGLSWPVQWMLMLLKIVYYYTPLLPHGAYKRLKRWLFNYVACKKESAFLLL